MPLILSLVKRTELFSLSILISMQVLFLCARYRHRTHQNIVEYYSSKAGTLRFTHGYGMEIIPVHQEWIAETWAKCDHHWLAKAVQALAWYAVWHVDNNFSFRKGPKFEWCPSLLRQKNKALKFFCNHLS